MAMPFDSEMLVSLVWRQGSILGPELARLAREYAPARVVVDDADRFIVTSHICGIGRFCKERGYSVIPVTPAPEPSDFDRAVRQLLNPEYEPIKLTGEDEPRRRGRRVDRSDRYGPFTWMIDAIPGSISGEEVS